jgi:hypothetical protein
MEEVRFVNIIFKKHVVLNQNAKEEEDIVFIGYKNQDAKQKNAKEVLLFVLTELFERNVVLLSVRVGLLFVRVIREKNTA